MQRVRAKIIGNLRKAGNVGAFFIVFFFVLVFACGADRLFFAAVVVSRVFQKKMPNGAAFMAKRRAAPL